MSEQKKTKQNNQIKKVKKMKTKIGQLVFWNDPDDNESSGIYWVVRLCGNIATIYNGYSEAEVLSREISQLSPSQLYELKLSK